jgi:hypothetical protein
MTHNGIAEFGDQIYIVPSSTHCCIKVSVYDYIEYDIQHNLCPNVGGRYKHQLLWKQA